MSDAAHYQRVREHLELLRLDAALHELDGSLERAAREERSPVWLLDHLLTSERTHRFERRVAANLKLSGIPNRKTLDDFDFNAQPGVSHSVVTELATLRFLRAGQNVLILGPTGVGKTHIAIGLTLKAIEHGHRAYFLTLHDLINKARAAREKHRLHVLHTTLLRADLFVLDEVGFQPLERDDATFLFEAINKRYAAQKSTIITSNKSYGQWHEIFPDPVLAVALLDRLLHHATTLNIRGDSYRLKARRDTGLPTPSTEDTMT
jgi:DNA replication protein DnaC